MSLYKHRNNEPVELYVEMRRQLLKEMDRKIAQAVEMRLQLLDEIERLQKARAEVEAELNEVTVKVGQ